MSSPYTIVAEAIEPLLKKHGLDHRFAIKLATEAVNALEVGGWHTTEDEHLAMMRTMRTRLFNAVNDDDCPARDLAALSNRLQTVSKEVVSLEEKERQEGASRKGGSDGGTTGSAAQPVDPTKV